MEHAEAPADGEITQHVGGAGDAAAQAEDAPVGGERIRPHSPTGLRIDSRVLDAFAHKLRGHIGTVQNALYLLRHRARDNRTLAPIVENIEGQLSTMNATLEKVVEADRLARDDVQLVPAPIELQAVIKDAVAGTARLRQMRSHSIEVDVPDTPLRLHADPKRLGRALFNVLDNASRYMRAGGSVELKVVERAHHVLICVSDTGSGVPDDRLDHLLRFHHPSSTGSASLGLGLPLAHAWLTMHGGSLEIDSSRAGTQVVICLPRRLFMGAAEEPQPRSGSAHAAPPEEAAWQSRAVRVLVVDDHESLRGAFRAALSEMGHAVEVAGSGMEALAVAESWHPDFVLLDIHMPGINGFEAARQLRARFPSPSMQLVMMSGNTLDPATIERAKQAGFDHWVDKTRLLDDLPPIFNAH